MELGAYIIRCIFMYLVTWAGVRLIGRKSIANMTSYDLSSIILITTVAAEPLVYKISTKATVGVATIVVITIVIGLLSLKSFFYELDTAPIVVIADGKIIKEALRQVHMNIPLLMSELRVQGYQNLKEISYAILEPSGKISVIPTSKKEENKSITLSFPLIIDGKIKEENLIFLKKDREWIVQQLYQHGVGQVEDVLFAQIDSQHNLYIDLKEKHMPVPPTI